MKFHFLFGAAMNAKVLQKRNFILYWLRR